MPRIHLLLGLMALALSMAVGAAASPAEAYLDYHTALKSSFSEASIWPHYTQAAREEFQRKFPPELRGRAFYMMKTTAPQAVQVMKEKVEGDVATLTLRPTVGDGRLLGTATLRLENGAWKLEKVVWQRE